MGSMYKEFVTTGGVNPANFDLISDEMNSARIQLADGQMFAPFAPHPEAFSIENIATGISNMCRFGGQVEHFYSVAQHSVLVAALCEKNLSTQKFALLHDAEEGFGLPDIPTPIKPFLPLVVEAQHNQSMMIFDRYGLDPSLKKRVKPKDTLALAMEKRDLKQVSSGYLTQLPKPPADVFIAPLLSDAARDLFLRAVHRVWNEKLAITKDWILMQPGFSQAPIGQVA